MQYFCVLLLSLHIALFCARKELSNNEYLEAAHGDHQDTLNKRQPYNSRFCALDSRQIAILTRPKVFLSSGDCG